MGTDIHCVAERRGPDGWEFVPLDFYCGEERNYALFAILAGVRRMTNAGFVPIAPPRGLPPDLSPPLQGMGDPSIGSCDHNHTWLTLRELMEFPWHERKRVFEVVVDAENYLSHRIDGKVNSIACRPTGRVVSNARMEQYINEGWETMGVYTEVTLEIPYADYAGPFVTETIPLLRTLGEPDAIRLVMWFDS